VSIHPTKQRRDHTRIGAQLVTGPLDESKLGSAFGGGKEFSRVIDGYFGVVSSVTNEKPPRWKHRGCV
jgi:hypothetical protein